MSGNADDASASNSASSKAVLRAALQQRLAQLEQQKKQQQQQQHPSSSHQQRPSRPTPQAVQPSSSAAKLAELERLKQLLKEREAKQAAARNSSPSPSPSPSPNSATQVTTGAGSSPSTSSSSSSSSTSASASTPVSAVAAALALKAAKAAGIQITSTDKAKVLSNGNGPTSSSSAAASSSTAASSSDAIASPVPAAAAPAKKPILCRSWLTCTFGTKCRYRHPTVNVEPFFVYGGQVLLHLNADTAAAAAATNMQMAQAETIQPRTMPPVLLLAVALIVQTASENKSAAADSTSASALAATNANPPSPPSMPLLQLWSRIKSDLAGCKDLPDSVDSLLNSMGLPGTAAVMQRAADGEAVTSTDAFRNSYACAFVISRQGTAFHVAHQWHEPRRSELQRHIQSLKSQQRARRGAQSSNSSRSMYDDGADDDLENRKRKRVSDAELEAANGGQFPSNKSARLGEAYPEEQRAQLAAPMLSAPSISHSIESGNQYRMDAGSELGGSTSFLRGGIVTELSLNSGSMNAEQLAQARAHAAYLASLDPFTRAIMKQREVTSNASYTMHTQRITGGKGYELLKKMNWKVGQGLGKKQQGRVEPLEVKFRMDRAGL